MKSPRGPAALYVLLGQDDDEHLSQYTAASWLVFVFTCRAEQKLGDAERS
jgi:hypothetical protein